MELDKEIEEIKKNINDINSKINILYDEINIFYDRVNIFYDKISNRKTLTINNNRIIIIEKEYKIMIDGIQLEATEKMYELFKYLYNKRHAIITRDELLNNVWGYEKISYGDPRVIDVTIARIRLEIKKITKTEIIKTRRQYGYFIDID